MLRPGQLLRLESRLDPVERHPRRPGERRHAGRSVPAERLFRTADHRPQRPRSLRQHSLSCSRQPPRHRICGRRHPGDESPREPQPGLRGMHHRGERMRRHRAGPLRWLHHLPQRGLRHLRRQRVRRGRHRGRFQHEQRRRPQLGREHLQRPLWNAQRRPIGIDVHPQLRLRCLQRRGGRGTILLQRPEELGAFKRGGWVRDQHAADGEGELSPGQ